MVLRRKSKQLLSASTSSAANTNYIPGVILTLPSEILLYIFQYCGEKELIFGVSLCCKAWSKLLEDEEMWWNRYAIVYQQNWMHLKFAFLYVIININSIYYYLLFNL